MSFIPYQMQKSYYYNIRLWAHHDCGQQPKPPRLGLRVVPEVFALLRKAY